VGHVPPEDDLFEWLAQEYVSLHGNTELKSMQLGLPCSAQAAL